MNQLTVFMGPTMAANSDRPRPRPPIKREHLQQATTAGVVDLQKLVRVREDEQQQRRAGIATINAEKSQIQEMFTNAFVFLFHVDFEWRSERQWKTWTDRKGKVFRRRLPSDKQRLYETWKRAQTVYNSTVEEFLEYLMQTIAAAGDRYVVENPRQVFGFVNHEGVLESWYMKRRGATADKNKDIEKRAAEHAELFER
jgi:hypothetical protein